MLYWHKSTNTDRPLYQGELQCFDSTFAKLAAQSDDAYEEEEEYAARVVCLCERERERERERETHTHTQIHLMPKKKKVVAKPRGSAS